MIISPTIQQTRCQSWLRRNLPPDSPVLVTDITSLYTAICLMGPLAQSVMSDVTDSSVSYKDFPFFTCKVNETIIFDFVSLLIIYEILFLIY